MHGIAEGIENGCHFPVDAVPMMPDVGHGNGNEFGESAGPVDPDSLGILAKLPPPGQTITTTPTNDVALSADDVAREKVINIGAYLNDLTDKFMTDDHWHGNGFLGPGIPLIDVKIGPANARFVHADEDIVDPDLWERDFLQPQTWF